MVSTEERTCKYIHTDGGLLSVQRHCPAPAASDRALAIVLFGSIVVRSSQITIADNRSQPCLQHGGDHREDLWVTDPQLRLRRMMGTSSLMLHLENATWV